MTTGGINLYMTSSAEKHKLDHIAARNIRMSQTVLIAAEPSAQYRMQVSKILTVNILSLESILVEIYKSISCNRNEP